MISGNVLLSAILINAVLLTTAPTSAPSPDVAAPDLVRFVARLAKPVPSSTRFAEVRFVRMLTRPLILHGELDYRGAGKLGKRIETPYREITTIADGAVEVQRAGRTPRHFSLDRAPALQGLLASFSALLGGDAPTLEKFYTVQLVENAPNWTLTLTPRAPELGKHLRDIVVDGAGKEPRCYTLHERDGDASVMLLGALAAAKLPDSPTPTALSTLCRAAP
jgi:hypothetical protein